MSFKAWSALLPLLLLLLIFGACPPPDGALDDDDFGSSDDDDDTVVLEDLNIPECGCSQGVDAESGSPWMLLLLGLVGLVRRPR